MMVAWVGSINVEPNTTKYKKSKSRSPLNITQPCVLFLEISNLHTKCKYQTNLIMLVFSVKHLT